MRLPAYPLYLVLCFASALFFALMGTIAAVYRATEARLDPFQLVMVGTVLEAVVLLFEVPTGVVADVYSRRLSIIIGFVLIGAGLVVEGSFPSFGPILLAQAIWGIGHTFTSGATSAWIADELGEERAARAYLRGAQAGYAGAILGVMGSVALASARLHLPIVVGGIGFIGLGAVLALVMPERHFTPAAHRERRPWRAMRDTLRAGVATVRGRRVLLLLLVISAIVGAASESFDRLWALHLLDNIKLPQLGGLNQVIWFGVMHILAMGLGFGVTEVVQRRVDLATEGAAARALQLIEGLLVLSLVSFGLAAGFPMALSAFCSVQILRRLSEPILAAWINRSLDPRVRATVLSIRSQADALGQVAGGPAIGAIGSLLSVRAALVAAGVILAPVVLIYGQIRLGEGGGEGEPGRGAGPG